RVRMAFRASCSSSPSSVRRSSLPCGAASSISERMLFPSTDFSSLASSMLLRKADAVATSFAAARACRPALLGTVMVVLIMGSADSRACYRSAAPLVRPRGLVWRPASGQFLVANLGIIPPGPEMLDEFFTQVHRTVLTTGTADGDGDVAAVVAGEAWQPFLEVLAHVVEHFLYRWLAGEEVLHLVVQTVERAQGLHPVRVGQAAGVEDDVGIHRHAVLEAEGLELQRQAVVVVHGDAVLDDVAQLVQVEVAGVEVEVGEGGDRLE